MDGHDRKPHLLLHRNHLQSHYRWTPIFCPPRLVSAKCAQATELSSPLLTDIREPVGPHSTHYARLGGHCIDGGTILAVLSFAIQSCQ